MLKGETTSGFNYEIPEENLNNYELLEEIGELETNPLALGRVVNLLLGKDQAKALKNHVRTDTNIVPSDKMTNEITEILQSNAQSKNS